MRNKNLVNFSERIFVAGASGMVGSSVCRMLNLAGYGNEAFQGKILAPLRNELDLLDTECVNSWFKSKKPTVVILAAAKVGGIYANATYPADFIFENLKIQNNVIEASWRNGVKRLIFLGSSCIYPKHAKQPIDEGSLLTGPLEPTNEWYAISKISGIKLCQALRKQYGFDAISLMPTNLYGPGDNYHEKNSHVMASLIKKFCSAVKFSEKEVLCWGTGNVFREFMHVDDLARAIIFALERWDPDAPDAPTDKNNNPYTLINVGTGKDISIKDLASKISEKVGFEGKIIWDENMPDGTPRKVLNIQKIKNLGWEPIIDLEDGLNKTIREFKKQFNN